MAALLDALPPVVERARRAGLAGPVRACVKVLAAVSGGVDSAVAAARAVDAGHDVTAVHLALARDPASARTGARGCCTLEDARDARRAADVLGIPFYVWDLAERFHADVVDDFVAEYAAGRTPNPCLRCNEKIKFAAVLDRALALGFDAVVTGHHARLDGRRAAPLGRPGQGPVVRAGRADPRPAGAGRCSRSATSTKAEVRAEAAARGLAVADKPDSHDVCFVADGDTRGFLRRALGDRPGPLVDAETGAEVGRHDGAYGFTVGQRRGLGLDRPGGDAAVRALDRAGGRHGHGRAGRAAGRGRGDRVAAGVDGRSAAGRVVRVPGPAAGARARCRCPAVGDGRAPATAVEVRLHEPVRGVATGQAVVLYDGDTVLGSATVSATARVEPAEAVGISR